MSHRNARTTYQGRLLIVERFRDGWNKAHIASAMGISRKCVHKWIRRFDTEGEAGLQDRSTPRASGPRAHVLDKTGNGHPDAGHVRSHAVPLQDRRRCRLSAMSLACVERAWSRQRNQTRPPSGIGRTFTANSATIISAPR